MNVKKGDTVQVLSGEDKGKTGEVLQVMPRSERVLVEGINFVEKHMRKTEDNPNGGVVSREAPIHVSNVKVPE